jgi:hypothetical protein
LISFVIRALSSAGDIAVFFDGAEGLDHQRT